MVKIDPSEFYSLIRLYFAQMSEVEKIPIAPLFGQRADVVITESVYFEYLNEKVFIVTTAPPVDREDAFYKSTFVVQGAGCLALTVRTMCCVEELPGLWRARKDWMEAGVVPKFASGAES